VFLWMP
ncbi:putative membrane protein, partial [Chlamydia psittaci 84-8471/1]